MNFECTESIFDDNYNLNPYDKESGKENIEQKIMSKDHFLNDFDDTSVCTTDCETVESESNNTSASHACEMLEFDSDESKDGSCFYSREYECRKRRKYRAEVLKSKRKRLAKPVPIKFRDDLETTVPDHIPIKLLPRKVRNRLSAIRSRGRELEKEELLTSTLCSLAATLLEYERLYPHLLNY